MAVSTKYKHKGKGLGTSETAYQTSSLTSDYSIELSDKFFNGDDASPKFYVKYSTSGGLYSYGWGKTPLTGYTRSKTPILAKYQKNMPMPLRDTSDPLYWSDLKGTNFYATNSGSSTKSGISVYIDNNDNLNVVGMDRTLSQADCSICILELQAKGGAGGSSYPSGGGGGGAYALIIVDLSQLSTKRLSIQNTNNGIYVYLNTSSASGTSTDYILIGSGGTGSGKNGFQGGGGTGGTVTTSGSTYGSVILQQVNGGPGGGPGDSSLWNPANGSGGTSISQYFLSYPVSSGLDNQSVSCSGYSLGISGTGGSGGEKSSGGGSDWEDGTGGDDGWDDGWNGDIGDFSTGSTVSTYSTTSVTYTEGGGGGGASMLGSGINGADSTYASFGSSIDSRDPIGYGGGGGGRSTERSSTATGGPYLIKVYI